MVKRIVLKVGSGYLVDLKDDGSYNINQQQFDGIVQEIASLIERGKEVVLVSSGAIAVAACKQKIKNISKDVFEKAQLSGEGQIYLMIEYVNRFEKLGKIVAQCLITKDDLEIAKRRENIKKNQEGYFKKGVITIYNENDLISMEEITFGDNDLLAAHLALTIEAEMLIMFSNSTEGLGAGKGESKDIARALLNSKGIEMNVIKEKYEKDEKGNILLKTAKMVI